MKRLIALLLCLFVLNVQLAFAQVGTYIRNGTSSITSPTTYQTYVFDQNTGFLLAWNGSAWVQISSRNSNYSATVAPTVANDNTQGYQIGSIWIDTTHGNFYQASSVATGAAVWNLYAGTSYSPAVLNSTGLQASDLINFSNSAGMVVSGLIGSAASSLTITMPSGIAYVNGNRMTMSSYSHTFTANKWTFCFLESNGTINYYPQSASTVAPTDSGLLFQNVETGGSTVTAVVSYNTISPILQSLLRTIPGTNNLPLQSDSTQIGGLAFEALPLSGLAQSGASTGNIPVWNGTQWGAQAGPTGTPNAFTVYGGPNTVGGGAGVPAFNQYDSGLIFGGASGARPLPVASPSAPTITQGGTAATTHYTYTVASVMADGTITAPPTGTVTTTGAATLTGSNFNTVTWTAVTGAATYNIYRTASSGTPSSTGLIGNTASATFNDTGIAGTGGAPSTTVITGEFWQNGNWVQPGAITSNRARLHIFWHDNSQCCMDLQYRGARRNRWNRSYFSRFFTGWCWRWFSAWIWTFILQHDRWSRWQRWWSWWRWRLWRQRYYQFAKQLERRRHLSFRVAFNGFGRWWRTR